MFKDIFSEMFLNTLAKVAIVGIAAFLGPLLYRLIFGRKKSSGSADGSSPKGVQFLGIVGFIAIILTFCVISDLVIGRFGTADVFTILLLLAGVGVLFYLRSVQKQKEEEEAAVDSLEVGDAPKIESESDDLCAASGQAEEKEDIKK